MERVQLSAYGSYELTNSDEWTDGKLLTKSTHLYFVYSQRLAEVNLFYQREI